MKRGLMAAAAVLSALSITGCTQTEQSAGTGAAIGGLAGGIIGHNKDRQTAEGVAIGAAVGALAGGIYGQQKDKAAMANQGTAAAAAPAASSLVKCPHCTQVVDVTGIPSGQAIKCPKCNGVFKL